MQKKSLIHSAVAARRRSTIRGKRKFPVRITAACGALISFGILIYSALADDQPVLTIAPTNASQFIISITNASNVATYELYRTPVLNDATYPWTLSVTGALGQSNFIVSKGLENSGFWRASVGTDWDSDGIPNWLDADPNNSGIGALSISITSPTNGTNID